MTLSPVFSISLRTLNFSAASLIFAAFLTLSGCSGSSPTPPQPLRGLAVVELDTLWTLGSGRLHRIVVRAYPVEWAAGRTLACVINGGGGQSLVRLYDDGGSVIRRDAVEFADSMSGDRLAGDGLYTRILDDGFAATAGDYSLRFAFDDGNPSGDTLRSSLRVVENSPPVIIRLTGPDSLHGEIEAVWEDCEVVALDPDGPGDVRRVRLTIESPRGAPFPFVSFEREMNRLNDSLWSLNLPHSAGAGIPTGSYALIPYASDYLLGQTGESVAGEGMGIWIENLPPRIISITSPDTVFITGMDTVSFFFIIQVDDPQSRLDLDSLIWAVSRPRSDGGEGDTLLAQDHCFDDGVSPDTLARDGIYTAGFSAHRGNVRTTPFFLDWTPVDRSPQRGETVRKELWIQLFGNGSPEKGAVRDEGSFSRVSAR